MKRAFPKGETQGRFLDESNGTGLCKMFSDFHQRSRTGRQGGGFPTIADDKNDVGYLFLLIPFQTPSLEMPIKRSEVGPGIHKHPGSSS